MNILLWVLQVLAALLYGASGVMKVFMFDKVSGDVPSCGALPRDAWMALGILELVCTVGLIVPAAFHWHPTLTVMAAPNDASSRAARCDSGGKRTARLRTLPLEAHAAAREVGDPAAAAAARAAGLAAASAYTHPLANVHQTKHIVGPAAYAALARELDHAGNPRVGGGEVAWAVAHAPSEARAVLRQMPAREPGKSRLDAGIRAPRRPSEYRPGPG